MIYFGKHKYIENVQTLSIEKRVGENPTLTFLDIPHHILDTVPGILAYIR